MVTQRSPPVQRPQPDTPRPPINTESRERDQPSQSQVVEKPPTANPTARTVHAAVKGKKQPTMDKFTSKIPRSSALHRTPPNASTSSPAIKRKDRESPNAISPSELSPDDKRSRENAYAKWSRNILLTDDESETEGTQIHRISNVGNPSPVRVNVLPEPVNTPAAASADPSAIEVEEIEDWSEGIEAGERMDVGGQGESPNHKNLPFFPLPTQISSSRQDLASGPLDVIAENRHLKQELHKLKEALQSEQIKNSQLESRITTANADFNDCRAQLTQTVDELNDVKRKLSEHRCPLAQNPPVPGEQSAEPSSDIDTVEIAILANSMGRGLAEELVERAGISAKGHIFPGATIPAIAENATHIFNANYQPKKIMVQVGGIDALRWRAPKVTKEYKRLVNMLKSLCPKSEIILSHLTYKDYHGNNSAKVVDGINRKTNRPEFLVPGDRMRIDNINHSLDCWAKSMENVSVIDATPDDEPSNFSRRDGLHFSREGRAAFYENCLKYFTCDSDEEEEDLVVRRHEELLRHHRLLEEDYSEPSDSSFQERTSFSLA